MTINITRREATEVFVAVICSAWVVIMGAGIVIVENTASLSRYFELQSWRASYPLVSMRVERSHARTSSPLSAVPVDSLHGVGRVLGPVVGRGLLKAAPGLAYDLPNLGTLSGREERLMATAEGHTQGGVRPVPAEVRGTDSAGFLQMLGGGAAWNANTRPGWNSPLDSDHLRLYETKEGATRRAGLAPGRHLQAVASAAAHLCAVPEPILYALISVESSWRQTDKAGRTLRSRSGALGLTQVKKSSAHEISPSLDPTDAFQNAVAGSCYLRKMFDRFGGKDWGIALKAYRVGPNSPLLHARTASDYSIAILGGAQ